MTNLYDVFMQKNVLTLIAPLRMVGAKRALLVGDQILISPAMFSLYTDKKITPEERIFILKNIPCHVVGTSQKVSFKNIKPLIKNEVL